jgi:hypothetical protein
MPPTETGKRRISTVEANAAKAEEERAPGVVILVRPIARVEELALAIGPAAALEPEIGPVEAGRELAQAAAVLDRARVVAVPERDQVAVPLRTKSATAAHRHDLVPLLTAEASAVAGVETSLAPAAAEAVTAWVAVDSAAVAADEAADTVAAAEDKQIISMREN